MAGKELLLLDRPPMESRTSMPETSPATLQLIHQRSPVDLLPGQLILLAPLGSPRRLNKIPLPGKTLPGLKKLAPRQVNPSQDLELLMLQSSLQVASRLVQPPGKKSLIHDKFRNRRRLLYPAAWAQLARGQIHRQHLTSRSTNARPLPSRPR